MERIEQAAIKHAGLIHTVPRPGRHHDVIREMAKRGFGPDCMHNQGFVTDMGRFVGREDALAIAQQANQLIRKAGPDNELFSEDLW